MRNKRISIKKVIFYICLLGLIILLVMPILWAMLLSLKTSNYSEPALRKDEIRMT